MLIHNKRLHPRRPGEHGEHYQGCVLHEIEQQQRNTLSPTQRSTNSSRYSSISSLNQRRSTPSSLSNYSTSSTYLLNGVSPKSSTPPLKYSTYGSNSSKRNSVGDFSNSSILSNNSSVQDSDDSLTRFKNTLNDAKMANKNQSKSVVCLHTHIKANNGTLATNGKKNGNTVKFKTYDSPEEIIASLFPSLDVTDNKTTYLKKGQSLKQAKLNGNCRSVCAGLNNCMACQKAENKLRSYSTSSDSSSIARERAQLRQNGRLMSAERDFENLRYNSHFCLKGI